MTTSIMIDIEALDVIPTATILTVGAQLFDPFGEGIPDNPAHSYYCRVSTESQEDRTVDDGTLAWWGTQPQEAQDEVFNEEGRVPLEQMLEELAKQCRKATFIFANGPTYDMTILENAYKSKGMGIPWSYSKVRDARTIYSLWPDLPKMEAQHNALDDCWRQIALLQATFQHLGIKAIV